ncbi:uncharacterized protein LOC132557742 [Ylistrum balloti]|uniref:uncharacterized protein LOC132557742 n=1 Tax=Ylistrum balloti TaxID=509963 RepID=UPI002905E344|nr:uncharacterized protein LOC132557742 [Ylistrum balloti]
MTGVKDEAKDSCIEEKQDGGKMVANNPSKCENDGVVDNLANNLSALTIKREPVEDNELHESLTNLESPSKGDKPSPDYEVKKEEVKREIATEQAQENSAFLRRGPTHGHATTNSIQHIGYNKGYGTANAQTFKDKKRGREEDGSDPPLRYMRPEDQVEYSSLTKDKSSLGMMLVKSPTTDLREMNFPSLNQDDILDLADQAYSPYPSNNGGQYNVSSQSHAFNQGLFSQNVYQQTALSQKVNGNVCMVNNQQSRPNNIDQMYGRREPYTSESESESAKSPYSDQLYSPDSSSVKSINSPPPSNMSNDSGIIGDLTVNSPPGNASPAYDQAQHSNYSTTWEEQSHQNSPSQVSNQSMASPPHIGGSQGMPQAASPMMSSVSSCLAANTIMSQQNRTQTMVSSNQTPMPLGVPNLVPTQSSSGAPLMTSQQFASHPSMVPTTSQPGAPMMISQVPRQINIPHAGVSQPNNVSTQITQQPVTMAPMMSSVASIGQPNVQYIPQQITTSHGTQLLNEQIDEKELNFVMEVLVDDMKKSNEENNMKNQACNKGMAVPPALAASVPQNVVTSPPPQSIPQNRNLACTNKPLQNIQPGPAQNIQCGPTQNIQSGPTQNIQSGPAQNIQPGPTVVTTVQNQNRIPVNLVQNNMIPITTPMPMPVTNAMTTPVLPQQPVSQAQMVLMPPGNQTTANGLQTTGNVVQQPMIIIVSNQNMNQPARSKAQKPPLKKILPKPGTSLPDSSKPANAAPVMTRNLNETGTRPVVPKPGLNQQTIYRQNLLNMARRTVADISRDRLRFQDDEGDTYLHVAVCKTDASMVQALIERLCREKLEVMIDIANCKRQTPLYLAVVANQPRMVNSLIARNANPCSMAQVCSGDGKSREVKTPLHVASSNGHSYLSTLQELLRSPAINLNIVNSEGHTALHCAILAHRRQNKNGQFIDSIPIIETLLKAGADPTSQDKKNGKTPLMYAIEKRDTPLVERMLSMFEPGEKLRNLIKFQTLDGSTCIKIAEGLKFEFQPENWQRLLNTLNAALNGDPPRMINGVM